MYRFCSKGTLKKKIRCLYLYIRISCTKNESIIHNLIMQCDQSDATLLYDLFISQSKGREVSASIAMF